MGTTMTEQKSPFPDATYHDVMEYYVAQGIDPPRVQKGIHEHYTIVPRNIPSFQLVPWNFLGKRLREPRLEMKIPT